MMMKIFWNNFELNTIHFQSKIKAYNPMRFFIPIIILFFPLIVRGLDSTNQEQIDSLPKIRSFTLDFYDVQRKRLIPVAVDIPIRQERCPVVIFSHGYDQNRGGSYLVYTYLTHTLAQKGYAVISIQHELCGDSLLAMNEPFLKTRMENWERGVQNIDFVQQKFMTLYPELNWNALTAIGHSNGGDMSVLFAQKYPERLRKVITLDHRRMPVPRQSKCTVYSLRASDCKADSGVFPADKKEWNTRALRIIQLDNIRHGDMDNKGTPTQHHRICTEILQMLEE